MKSIIKNFNGLDSGCIVGQLLKKGPYLQNDQPKESQFETAGKSGSKKKKQLLLKLMAISMLP